MPKRINITGQQFGYLKVIRFHDNNPSGRARASRFLCQCVCGKEVVCIGTNLKLGKPASCGCKTLEIISQKRSTHGQTRGGRSKEYRCWKSMKERCLLESCGHYRIYGGRGISVCDRWMKFENFLEDMGKAPSPLYTLERKDVNGDYSPNNCRWATIKEQSRNRRTNIFATHDGEKLCALDWSRKIGVPVWSVIRRLKEGWDIPKIKSHYL